jgi:NPCBM/NEW2 domain
MKSAFLSLCLVAVGGGWFACPTAAAADAPRRETVPLAGERFPAALLQIDPPAAKPVAAAAQSTAGTVTLQQDKDQRTLPLAELVSWGALAEATGAAQLLLADGGLIVAEVLTADKDAIKVDSPTFGEQTIPLELLAAIAVHPPGDAQRRDRFAERLLLAGRATDRANADRVYLDNGDELTGTILAIHDGKDNKTVELDAAVGKVAVERAKIAGIAFNPSLVAAAGAKGPRVLAGFADGSRLAALALAVHGEVVELTLFGGLKWKAPRAALVFVQPLGGKVTYLSDLSAESYRHIPFLNTSWPYRADKNVAGTQLRSGGHLFAKGIGMHSASRLTYRLNGLYKRFDADVALDDQVGTGGSAAVRVFVDGQERYKSDPIRGGAAPVPVSVDVTGGKQLSLIVDFADRGDELDRVNWLNARLVE